MTGPKPLLTEFDIHHRLSGQLGQHLTKRGLLYKMIVIIPNLCLVSVSLAADDFEGDLTLCSATVTKDDYATLLIPGLVHYLISILLAFYNLDHCSNECFIKTDNHGSQAHTQHWKIGKIFWKLSEFPNFRKIKKHLLSSLIIPDIWGIDGRLFFFTKIQQKKLS